MISLSRASLEPFLQFSERRDLREIVYNAYVKRGAMGGKSDNRAIIAEILALRAEMAKLLGFPNLRRLPDRQCDGEDAGTGAPSS